jgi:heat shock protein HslJ
VWTVLVLGGLAAAACAPAEPAAEGDSGGGSGAAEAVAAPGEPRSTDEVVTYQGMMTYLADAPTFVDCATGLVLPLAQEAGYPALERSYLASRTGPGEPLLVTVLGRVETRPGMEGGSRASLVVAEVREVLPQAGCGEAEVDRPFEDTQWRLETLAGVPAPPGVAATIRFLGERGEFEGYAGCGPFSGRYELSGSRLTLALTAGAGMVCGDEGSDGLRRDYLDALRTTGGFRLLGPVLELLGEVGPAARFRAPVGG